MKYNKLDTKALIVMRINALIKLLIIIGTFLIYDFINFELEKELEIIFNIAWGLIFSIFILNVFIFPNIRYNRYHYLISNDKIDVKYGLFIINRVVVPINRVQKIELFTNPISRFFKLTSIVIYTAAGITNINYLTEEEATKITNKINSYLGKIDEK